jgi:hypothetical protein
VGSVHPLMTFVRGSRPSLAGVPFAIEGDQKAVRAARAIVRDLRGRPFTIRKRQKEAYHAWGMFTSPFTDCLARGQRARSCGRRSQPKSGPRKNAANCQANAGQLRTAGCAGIIQRSHRAWRRCHGGKASQRVTRDYGSAGSLRCSGARSAPRSAGEESRRFGEDSQTLIRAGCRQSGPRQSIVSTAGGLLLDFFPHHQTEERKHAERNRGGGTYGERDQS